MMAKASAGLDTKSAREKEDAYLKEFGLVEVDGRWQRHARRGGQAAENVAPSAVRQATWA